MNTLTPGQSGGLHVTDGPLTTPAIRETAPGLLRNEIDSRVVLIRPMATPVDQISRMIGARHSSSMIVDYYSVDTKAQTVKVTGTPEPLDELHPDGYRLYSMSVDTIGVIAPTDTLLVPDAEGPAGPLALYVTDRTEARNTFRVIALNGADEGGVKGSIDAELRGHTLVRMGRAAAELDVQTLSASPKIGLIKCEQKVLILQSDEEREIYRK